MAVLAAVLLAAGALGAAAAPASAAPGDQVSISMPRLLPDFGYVKQGTVVVRTIDILNDGTDSVTIDPAPLSALTGVFALTSTSITATDVIAPGQRRTITVTLTAPPAPLVPTQTVTLTAVDHDRPGTAELKLQFRAESLTTDRAFFEVSSSGGISPLAFGSVEVGKTVTKRLFLSIQGIDPLAFAESDVRMLDLGSLPLPSMRVGGSSFGTGATYAPGRTATVDVTFAPTAAGSLTGTIQITGRPMNGDPEAKGVTQVIPFTASATAVVVPPDPKPTPSPTPTPSATPSPTPVPSPAPTSAGGAGSSSRPGGGGSSGGGASVGGASGTRSGSGSGTLANTGGDVSAAVWFSGLTMLAGAIALAGAWRMRRRTR
ncbi:choice-of-anchor D domain-containing protein [Herbiconiux liangxiaofengii]|uniref:choice-of-anchor D domain-containing protein n=1 Tax=Herbiconiux liangxiaofengii TaxID=3342795 RepID=UPI0035B88750